MPPRHTTSWMTLTCSFLAAFAFMTYVTFGLIYLVKFSPVVHSCPRSRLWLYILCSVLFLMTAPGCIPAIERQIPLHYCCGFVVLFIFAAWGLLEIINSACPQMHAGRLWQLGVGTVIWQWVLMLVLFKKFIGAQFAAMRETAAQQESQNQRAADAHRYEEIAEAVQVQTGSYP